MLGTNYLSQNPLVYTVPILSSIIAFNYLAGKYEYNLISPWPPIEVSFDLYDNLSEIINKNDLHLHLFYHGISTVMGQVVLQFFNDRLNYYYQGFAYDFEHIKEYSNVDKAAGNNNLLNSFKSKFYSYLPLIILHTSANFISSFIDNYFQNRLSTQTQQQITERLLTGNNLLQLSQNKTLDTLINKFHTDLETMAKDGSAMITSAMSVAIKGGIYGCARLYNKAPDTIIYSWLFAQAMRLTTENINMLTQEYNSKLKEQDTQHLRILNHDLNNINIISEKDGIEYTKFRLQELNNEILKTKFSINFWHSTSDLLVTLQETINAIFNFGLVGYKIYSDQISFEQRSLTFNSVANVQSLFLWSNKNTKSLSNFYPALENIKKFINELTKLELALAYNSSDVVQYNTNLQDQLILSNIEMMIGNSSLLNIDRLELEISRRFALVGDSGKGKSSLLSLIKGIVNDHIKCSGSISFPIIDQQKSNITMISQHDYFPIDISLLEVIFYPKRFLSNEERLLAEKKAISLLKAINIDIHATQATNEGLISLINEKLDWANVLSGGQRKKIAIISAIIKNPNILILDEVFSGMDPKSINDAQKLLMEYLLDTLFLVVDHHALYNNFNKFYNAVLHFSNSTVYLYNSVEEFKNFSSKSTIDEISDNVNVCGLNDYWLHHDTCFVG